MAKRFVKQEMTDISVDDLASTEDITNKLILVQLGITKSFTGYLNGYDKNNIYLSSDRNRTEVTDFTKKSFLDRLLKDDEMERIPKKKITLVFVLAVVNGYRVIQE
jgi:hypothetical protein